MIVVPSAGKAAMLELVVRSGLTLHLFANDIEPGPQDTLGSFVEPSEGGYKPKGLMPKQWVVKNGIAAHPATVYTFSGPTQPSIIYGYFVTLGNIVMWAERLPKPFPVNLQGDTLTITPSITFLEK